MSKNTTNAFVLSKRLLAASLISSVLILQSCSDDGRPRLKEFDEKTIYESTKGVVTEVEEIEPGNEYTIIDEKIIDDKDKSIAIVHTLEGTTDTLSLKKVQSEKSPTYRYSGLQTVLFYGLARSFFTNNLSNVTPDSRYYKDASAYNKSAGLKNQLQSSAATRRVKVPRGASTGYGKSKSFRSFGG